MPWSAFVPPFFFPKFHKRGFLGIFFLKFGDIGDDKANTNIKKHGGKKKEYYFFDCGQFVPVFPIGRLRKKSIRSNPFRRCPRGLDVGCLHIWEPDPSGQKSSCKKIPKFAGGINPGRIKNSKNFSNRTKKTAESNFFHL
jgi:hypothetical protein